MRSAFVFLSVIGVGVGCAQAEVISSSGTGFQLAHEAQSSRSPDELFARLMEPSQWWDPEHSYSGDASNLSMADEAGAYWREDWRGGSVIHGQVLQVIQGKMLMLSAPFGPLAATGAKCIWTISLEPSKEGGTVIKSTHRVVGGPETGLAELSGPVDFVMGRGIQRLAAD